MFLKLAVALALAGPPAGLTAHGRTLWNFEALLHDTFGAKQVCKFNGPYSRGLRFSDGSCSPLAQYGPYFPTFTNASHSRFHLTSKSVLKMNFGNYPIAIIVRGQGVACDRAEKTFLVELVDASSFTVTCVAPL